MISYKCLLSKYAYTAPDQLNVYASRQTLTSVKHTLVNTSKIRLKELLLSPLSTPSFRKILKAFRTF